MAGTLIFGDFVMRFIVAATVCATALGVTAPATASIAGQDDGAMTYEPCLSGVRNKPDAGRIIATTLDYQMVMDTERACAATRSALPLRG